jgi:predicted ATPase
MLISRLRLENWRNFRELDVPLRDVTYILGANASGKSNLLDVFRFLRDVGKSVGGGLSAAVNSRGGFDDLRSLHSPSASEVLVDVELSEDADEQPLWRYVLGFRSLENGMLAVSREEVARKGEILLRRPGPDDIQDDALLSQTHLEQTQANARFREIAAFFSGIRYLHLVPQLLKYPERAGVRSLDDDPFGAGFLEKLAGTDDSVRRARLEMIEAFLRTAVPGFDTLQFVKDERGNPRLRMLHSHSRAAEGWRSEESFSDGTLRLIGLLWSLQEGGPVLLLDKPELSLNEGIAERLPEVMERLRNGSSKRSQLVICTQSEALLSNPGIDGRGVIALEVGEQGSRGRVLNTQEMEALDAGFSISEAVLPKLRPKFLNRLGLKE